MTHKLLRSFHRICLAFIIISTALVAQFQPAPAEAASITPATNTITVNTISDDATTCATAGTTCLRNALTTAHTNTGVTTINFSVSGTIKLGSTLTINDTSANAITIDGSGQTIVIDGGSTSQLTGTRIFCIPTVNVLTLTGLTLQNGISNGVACAGVGTDRGGGAIDNHGTLTILNSNLSGNMTENNRLGGAISKYGALTVTSSVFSNNVAADTGFGGALYNSSGSLTLTNTTFNQNTAEKGGGVDLFSAAQVTVVISGCTFSRNHATQFGGGLEDDSQSGTSILNSTFDSNHSDVGAGGIAMTGAGTITNSTISNNTIPTDSGVGSELGGGIFVNGSGSMFLRNSTVAGNTGAIGGGIANQGGILEIGNSTIAGNNALFGGGVEQESGLFYALSTLLTGNVASTMGPNVDGVVHSYGYNLISDASGSTGFTGTGDQTGVNPNIGSLANNGGPVKTIALNPDTPPLTKGFCGGSGNSGIPALTTDARGILRKNPTGSGVGCDVGAFELPNPDSIGIYRAGTFYLRLHNSTGNADLTVAFTAGTKPYPVVGDWTGAGFDTVGVFNQNNGQFTLCTANVTATCANTANQKTLILGVPNDQPLSGRWTLNATNAGVGVFRPSNGLIYLKSALTTGYADYTMVLGIPGDVGLAGDWSGKGFDSPGVYRPSNSAFYLSNQVVNGSVYGDYQFAYGVGGDAPVVGDWIGVGHDGVGLFRQSNGFTYLKNLLVTGYADNTFTYGIAGDVPVAGHWQVLYPPKPPVHAAEPPILIPSPTGHGSAASGSIPSDGNIGD